MESCERRTLYAPPWYMVQCTLACTQVTIMKSKPTSELHDFRDFLTEILGNGSRHLSPEEALKKWRHLHPDPEEFEEEEDDIAAIQAALDDLDRGEEPMPFEEFDREFRKRHNIPPEK